jgi:hypothetical protein
MFQQDFPRRSPESAGEFSGYPTNRDYAILLGRQQLPAVSTTWVKRGRLQTGAPGIRPAPGHEDFASDLYALSSTLIPVILIVLLLSVPVISTLDPTNGSTHF